MKKHAAARSLLIISGAAGIILFLLPVFAKLIVNIGNITGIFICLCVLLYGVFMPRVNGFICRFVRKTYGIVIVTALSAVALVILGLAVVGTVCMIRASNNKADGQTTVVILGCKVNGKDASLMLIRRVDAAYGYLTENSDAVCIISGGQGYDEDISEAECMYRILTSRGISPDRLFLEDQSTSTRENLLFSKEIITANSLNSDIAIATNEFHEYRASVIADSIGLKASALPAETSWYLLPTYYIRELYGIVLEWIT